MDTSSQKTFALRLAILLPLSSQFLSHRVMESLLLGLSFTQQATRSQLPSVTNKQSFESKDVLNFDGGFPIHHQIQFDLKCSVLGFSDRNRVSQRGVPQISRCSERPDSNEAASPFDTDAHARTQLSCIIGQSQNTMSWLEPWLVNCLVEEGENSFKIECLHLQALRQAVANSAPRLAHIGSYAFREYSRLICMLCLCRLRAESNSAAENWRILKALSILYSIDGGYTTALCYYIADRLANSSSTSGERRKLFKFFGSILRHAPLPPETILSLAERASSAIAPVDSSVNGTKLPDSAPMWTKFDSRNFTLIPSAVIDSLQTALAEFSLPKLLVSRNAVSTCTELLECAANTLGTDSPSLSGIRTEVLRLFDIISSKSKQLSKFSTAESLQHYGIRAIGALDVKTAFPLLKAVIEDTSDVWHVESKKQAIKYLLRFERSGRTENALSNVLRKSCADYLDACVHSPLADVCKTVLEECSQRRPLILRSHSSLDIPIDPRSTLQIALSETQSKNTAPLLSEPSLDEKMRCVSKMRSYYEDMTKFEAALEAFTRYKMTTLQRIARLVDRPDQHDPASLLELQHALEDEQLHPDSVGTHHGLLPLVQAVVALPNAQKELILSILRQPRLLGDPLFLYHLSRVCVGFAVIASATTYISLESHLQIHPTTTTIEKKSTSTLSGISPVSVPVIPLQTRLPSAPLPSTSSHIQVPTPMLDQTTAANHTLPQPGSSAIDIDDPNALPTLDSSVTSEDTPAAVSDNFRKRKEKALRMIEGLDESDEAPPSPKRAPPAPPDASNEEPASSQATSKNKKAKKVTAKTTATKEAKTKKTGKKSASKQKIKTQVCKLWIQHRCFQGDDCSFLHEGEQAKFDEICRFFRTGSCTKGDACPYSHDLKSEACNNMVRFGVCKFAERCAYSHEENKIQAAKAALAAKQLEEAKRLEEEQKATQLTFAQHLIPITPQQQTQGHIDDSSSTNRDLSRLGAIFSPEFASSIFAPSHHPVELPPLVHSHATQTHPNEEQGSSSSATPLPVSTHAIAPSSHAEDQPTYIPPSLAGLLRTVPTIPTELGLKTVLAKPSLLPTPPLSLLDQP